MVAQYNAAAQSHGLSPDRMRAVQGDLLAGSGPLDDPDLSDFDVAVISMALHHVEDPEMMVKKLAERLRPGGSLVVVDRLVPAGTGPPLPASFPAAHTVTRQGFGEEEILGMFAAAGLSDHGFLLYPRLSKVPPELGGDQQLFFARGKTLI